jgi:UDP-glucose 4-epimerase
MSVLVTGGAGYIGSVTVEQLRKRGERVVVLDNLSRGHRAALDTGVAFVEGNVGDRALVARVVEEHAVEACVHFAAFAYVGESVEVPERYFENNVEQGLALLDALVAAGVRAFVFSSTCATYGEPVEVPISENHPQKPTNPYGWTKFFLERALEAHERAHGVRSVALRYFNAAGATTRLGEDHAPETHLIPNVLAAARGALEFVTVFGDTYPTDDGTAVRDYIHVSDLADAHLRALGHLRTGGGSLQLNLGTGTGYSVLEVVDAARRVTGRSIATRIYPSRPGDPSKLVADARRAGEVLGWTPVESDIDAIVGSAWAWHLAHPRGYEEK